MNNPKTRRILTFVLPILSLAVSTFIVTHEYSRKAMYTQYNEAGTKERAALIKLLPAKSRASAAAKHDDHDDPADEQGSR